MKRPASGSLFVWVGALAALAILTLWFWNRARPETGPPDIVFVVVDTLRADHLPAYGYEGASTPNIDRLAATGVLYERVVAPSSWTKTSMASIWTSRNALRHGVLDENSVLPDGLTTLAVALRDAGYRTVGVNSNPWLKKKFGFTAGFEVYETLLASGGLTRFGEVNERAIELARAPRDRRPLFLYVHYMDVHAPYVPESGSAIPASLEVPGHGALENEQLELMYRKESLDAPGVQQRVKALYDATIEETDAALGALLESLPPPREGAERVVVLTSDHGEGFREHGTTEHGWNVYPEVYTVPLILSGANRLAAGSRLRGQVRSIDLAPTVLQLVGVGAPESFDGTPLPFDADREEGDRVAVSSVGLNYNVPDSHFVAVVSGAHLFIRERVQGGVEFYDLGGDPGARKDLGYEHPEAGRYAEIERALFLEETGQEELEPETVDALRSLGYLN